MRSRAFVAGVAVLLLSSAGYALDPLGPPRALLGGGNWGLGVEYGYSEALVTLKDGALMGAPVMDDATQLQAHAAYANLRYGVCRQADVFARLGALAVSLPLLQEGDAGLAGGLGAAATLYDTPQFDWGLLVQFSRGQSEEHNPPSVWARVAETQIQSLQIATGPTFQVREDLAAYGGAFYHQIWGHYQSSMTRWDFQADHPFGVFAGLNWQVKQDAHWSMELQYAGATFALTTGLRWILD